ncbi:Branched-chain amino acid transport system permease protein livM [[Clostridium] ultunense Esp]|nr:Branched-chain amino acid transport system permease protein livM [[Clostridium] ultunense Esp]
MVKKISFLLFILIAGLLPLFFMESRSSLIILVNIAIMAIFAMSYDLLLGFTGIVSFGHVMYFGIGAFTTGILMREMGAHWGTLLFSFLLVMIFTTLLSLLLGAFTTRIKSHFFAMLTLAVAELLAVIAEKWKSMTGGADGFSYSVPAFFKDKLTFSYVAIAMMLLIYFLLRTFTLSPMGRILIGIRENERRMEALGYPVLRYKLIASVVAGVVAGFAGILYGIGMRFVSVPSVLGVDLTLDALLMTIVGGVGTLIGAVLGAGLIELVSQGLQDLSKTIPFFERWLLFIGLVYILAVRFFPLGIVGTIYQMIPKSKGKGKTSYSSVGLIQERAESE